METFMKLLETIQTFVWGPPTLVLLMGTGLYFTYKLRGIQICKFPRALKSIFEKEEGAGDVSPFATLCTTLAADIGTGSIVGVATALRIGGPGAMFWMWVSALLGMTTKYAEALLAVKFRVKDEKGEIAGGPMYYIENGMGDKFKWLAKIFAFFGVVTALLGCGTFPQVNAITESVHDSFHIPVIVIGINSSCNTWRNSGNLESCTVCCSIYGNFFHWWFNGDSDREPFRNSGSICRDIFLCIF